VIAGGAVLLALGVAAMGHVAAPWQLHAAFVCVGLGYATMSVIGLSATIAPWFEKHQGRAVALSIARHGFSTTTFVYGFCLGQISTLSPIVVRREFGAASFGTVYGVAGTAIQLSSAFGPALYGIARDLLGSYPPVLTIAAGFELAALAVILAGGRLSDRREASPARGK
jgi:MFS family permease